MVLTDAAPAVLAGDEARVADAVESTLCVDAAAVLAHGLPALQPVAALVAVLALIGLRVASLAVRALARERPYRVDALAAATQPGDSLTLINVWITKISQVSDYYILDL